ncbi:MAG: ATP-binding protein [Micrococcaceae bacterium]
MVERLNYLERLKKLQDKHIIKVITGVRRCGKSTLLLQFQDYLKKQGVDEECITSINFEDLDNEPLLDYKKLHKHIVKNLVKDEKNYVFLDEIQLVPEFQKAVDSLFLRDNIDLYITGSNASLLSGELATYLSGRYIEVSILPLSFKEYYEMSTLDKRDAWSRYFQYGGFPYAATLDDEEVYRDYLLGIYNTVLLKDIVARKNIKDVTLLESVVRFLFSNVGNIVSSKKIADTLNSNGRKTTPVTVESYVKALEDSFILYKANRFDVKGKQHLKTLEKYYLVDLGLRRLLLGDKRTDIGHLLENIIYLELLRRGYKVKIGKVGSLEVDFISERAEETLYIQVAKSVEDDSTLEREIAPFKEIKDHYPKMLITLDEYVQDIDGIKELNAIDFLLDD